MPEVKRRALNMVNNGVEDMAMKTMSWIEECARWDGRLADGKNASHFPNSSPMFSFKSSCQLPTTHGM